MSDAELEGDGEGAGRPGPGPLEERHRFERPSQRDPHDARVVERVEGVRLELQRAVEVAQRIVVTPLVDVEDGLRDEDVGLGQLGAGGARREQDGQRQGEGSQDARRR
jgi:hypothetical protein